MLNTPHGVPAPLPPSAAAAVAASASRRNGPALHRAFHLSDAQVVDLERLREETGWYLGPTTGSRGAEEEDVEEVSKMRRTCTHVSEQSDAGCGR